MLNAEQINKAKNKLVPCIVGKKNSISHIPGKEVDILTFSSKEEKEKIEKIAEELGNKFGYKRAVTVGNFPGDDNYWYQIHFS